MSFGTAVRGAAHKLGAAALIGLLILAAPANADAVDDLVKRQMAQSRIPGAAVAVVQNGEVVKLAGYGEAAVEWSAPATVDTPFQLASGTKIFTGVILMRLVEKGELKLEDRLDRFYPEAPDAWKQITVRHLAEHTSGMDPGFGAPPPKTLQEAVANAMKVPLAYPTGSDSRYGLSDFIVLQSVMEKASGLSFEELIDREIRKPLGLQHTGFNYMRDEANIRYSKVLPGRVITYTQVGGERQMREVAYPWSTYAAGGLFSSASDIAKLFAAIQNGTYLKPESFETLITPPTLSDGRKGGFGVGWVVRDYRGLNLVGHAGGPALADILYVPKMKLAIVALTNQFRFYPIIAQDILDMRLPAKKATVGIRDRKPEVTKQFLAALRSAESGKLDGSFFTDRARDGALGYWNGYGQGFLAAMGPARSAVLLSEKQQGDLLVRTYAVAFALREAQVSVRFDKSGKLAGLIPID